VQVGHQLQVLLPGQQFVDRRELAGDADRGAHRLRLGPGVVAGHPHRAAVRRDQRGQHVHRGGLARAVRPEQGEDRARGHLEIDAVEDRPAPEGLA
jgi:hypothetical protein